MNKKIIVLCATNRDKRELAATRLVNAYTFIYEEKILSIFEQVRRGTLHFTTLCFTRLLDHVTAWVAQQHADGIMTTVDYPGPLCASIIAHRLGLSYSTPDVIVLNQHKYYARLVQARVVPSLTPPCTLVDPTILTQRPQALRFPLFIKPVKSSFSAYAYACASWKELYALLQQKPVTLSLPLLVPFAYTLGAYVNKGMLAHALVAESLLAGVQVTLEGFIYDGQVTVLGIVDSIMFPHTISFARFEYPSRLPAGVQERMTQAACIYIPQTGLHNTLFNIEFMYKPETDALAIIEVNVRMSSQFADLFEKVDGINSYALACQLALNQKPTVQYRAGHYAVAASCVLRTFKNQKVIQVPTKADQERVNERFPGSRIEIHVQPGTWLSDYEQDSASFRYGLIHVGAASWEQLYADVQECLQMLPFTLTL